MLNLPNLPVFLAAALALLLVPGPAVLYIVARSLDQGRLAGLVSVLGIEVGNSVYVLAAALGLSAILASSALAFSIVKYAGTAYLVFMGIRRLLAHAAVQTPDSVQRKRLGQIFRQGMLVAILNPKTALFFFAFLPQFVDSARGAVPFQLLTLGCLFALMAICTDSAYALLAGSAGNWLKNSRGFLQLERYLVGSIYLVLGVLAAFGSMGQK